MGERCCTDELHAPKGKHSGTLGVPENEAVDARHLLLGSLHPGLSLSWYIPLLIAGMRKLYAQSCNLWRTVCTRLQSDGVVAAEVLQQFDKSCGKAMLSTTAKQAANADTHTGRWKHRDDKHKKNDDKRDDRKPPGGKGGENGRGGLCQSVYLAVPTARLYLRELYVVLAEKRSWGANVKISRAAWSDLEWWSRLPVMSKWNGRRIWRPPTRAKVHTDSSKMAWGGVLNLKQAARGFWADKMRGGHITHLELEAVYKTVQALLWELESKVVRLYCDNQAVVAMLSHFTSRNPDLMRRMHRLWSLLDSHDIELQARYIHSEANVWADGLSRCEDLDDWRLNRDWFEWADKQWGPYTVDRFASEISAQLPRLEVFWVDDDKFYPEVVKGFNEDGTVHVVYDDGDEKSLNLSEEKFNIKRSADVAEQNDEAAEVRRSLLDSTLNKHGPKAENDSGSGGHVVAPTCRYIKFLIDGCRVDADELPSPSSPEKDDPDPANLDATFLSPSEYHQVPDFNHRVPAASSVMVQATCSPEDTAASKRCWRVFSSENNQSMVTRVEVPSGFSVCRQRECSTSRCCVLRYAELVK
eukprot:gene15482-biopygen15947